MVTPEPGAGPRAADSSGPSAPRPAADPARADKAGTAASGTASPGSTASGTDPAGTAASGEVDWDALRERARAMLPRAYVPYSRFPVGVAALVEDGRVVTGCNVENAAYGVGLCAECGLVSHLHATGGGRLVAVACVGGDGQPLLPCGRCRQLLWENGTPETLVDTPLGILPMTELLPQAFGVQDLDAAENRRVQGEPA